MNRKIILFMIALTSLSISGCGIDYSLPENPIEFYNAEFINPTDNEDTYLSIEYNGRTYIPYGTLTGKISGKDIDKCIGYIVQDGAKMEDVRICLLSEDKENNYLAEIDTVGFMSMPIFFRDIDTAGNDISTPSFIENLNYDFWK